MNNFAPRVGVAWDVNGNGRTVVRGGYGIYYNHISGTSVHAAEAPWTGTVQLFNGRIEDPFGSLNSRRAALRRSDLRRVRVRADQRISRAELPALSAAAQLRLQRSGDGDADRAPLQRVVPASAHERLHGRRGVRRQVRVQAGRASPLQSGAVHQLAADRGGARRCRTSPSACSTSPASSVRRRACSRRAIRAGTTASSSRRPSA